MQGQDALTLVKNRPLEITQAQADAIDRTVLSQFLAWIKPKYDAGSAISFTEIPAPAQTAIISAAYQLGSSIDISAPNYWGHITNQEWRKAIAELRNWDRDGDDDSRRLKEADYLEANL